MKEYEKENIKTNGLFSDGSDMFLKAQGEVRSEVRYGVNNIQEEFLAVEMVCSKDINFLSPTFITYTLEDVYPVGITNQLLELISFKVISEDEKKIFKYEDCSISKDAGENNNWTFTSETLAMDRPVSFIHEVQNFVSVNEEYKKRITK